MWSNVGKVMSDDKLAFCENFVYLNRARISFEGRPYLPEIYASQARNLVLRCSRQTEKSTFLVNTILYEACRRPGISILFVSPRMDQARVFSRSRLITCLEQSPLVRRTLLGKSKQRPPVQHLHFVNDSQLFIRAAFHSADAARGISADLLLVDEFQDIAAGDLPVLQETLSHSIDGRTILTGTPKLIDNHLEAVFSQSTANEWTVECSQCGKGVIFDERSIGPTCIECPDCHAPVNPAQGKWVPRNPNAIWGAGYWINHLMVPWVSHDRILENQRVYDLARFKNEDLGLPTVIGEHIVTRAELEACCSSRPMAETLQQIVPAGRGNLVAGIDWGGGGSGGTSRTVLVIGYMRSSFDFEVCRIDRFRPNEHPQHVLDEVAKQCRRFRVKSIAADSGNGHVNNRLLFDLLGNGVQFNAIYYSASDHQPRREGVILKWTVNRSATIGNLFSRIKMKKLLFPRVNDVASFLGEFECEVAEYDHINRSIRYSHPETRPDDAMHATNYALILAVRLFSESRDPYE